MIIGYTLVNDEQIRNVMIGRLDPKTHEVSLYYCCPVTSRGEGGASAGRGCIYDWVLGVDNF